MPSAGVTVIAAELAWTAKRLGDVLERQAERVTYARGDGGSGKGDVIIVIVDAGLGVKAARTITRELEAARRQEAPDG